ncbi:MAG: hypothetical protein OEU25_01560 [Rhodospirillales bacterium]|nr:hypothetical protein [Rhodospirillales bacterium]
MIDRRFQPWPFAVLASGLALSACGTAEGPAPGEETVVLEADFFQQRWEDGGATLLIKAVDGRVAWRSRMALPAGRHEVLFEYEVTAACTAEKGCAVRRYHDRIEFSAKDERMYRLSAEYDDGAVHSSIEDSESGETVAGSVTAEARVEYEGYPNEAWQGLCNDAERGDAKARRAIGLHYWRGWWPTERDVVRAYLWLSLAMHANDSAAAHFRDRLGDEMNGHEIVEAERRVRRWKPGHCAVGADRALPRDPRPKPAAEKPPEPKAPEPEAAAPETEEPGATEQHHP